MSRSYISDILEHEKVPFVRRAIRRNDTTAANYLMYCIAEDTSTTVDQVRSLLGPSENLPGIPFSMRHAKTIRRIVVDQHISYHREPGLTHVKLTRQQLPMGIYRVTVYHGRRRVPSYIMVDALRHTLQDYERPSGPIQTMNGNREYKAPVWLRDHIGSKLNRLRWDVQRLATEEPVNVYL